ncbi:MAG: hypothetical protein WBQ27_03225, partial [Thermoanaerobaculia bacterium]
FFAPWYARRVLGIPIRRFWTAVWVRPGVAMIPFAIGSHLLERWWPATNLVLYFAQIAMVLPLAALGAWGFVLTPAEKEHLAPILRPLMKAVQRGRK